MISANNEDSCAEFGFGVCGVDFSGDPTSAAPFRVVGVSPLKEEEG